MSSLHVHTLDNGLTVLLLEHHTSPVVTFWIWYRVGSRNEVPGSTGISHWVEHMLFKGTPTHPRDMLRRYIERLGGHWNAFTWKDYTAYHEVLPAEHLGVAVALEADRMANTIIEPSEVERERTVVISEREGSENFPGYLLREDVDAVAYKLHPYRIPVIGWKEDLRAITRDDLVDHYETFYHPNNAIAVAVGALEPDATLELIRRTFGEIPPGPTPPSLRTREPAQEGERRLILKRPGGATAYLHVAYHGPAASHPDLAALLVVDGLLSGFKSVVPFDQAGGGRSSRLYRALVETGLASEVSSSIIPGRDPTLFRIMATVRAGGEVAAVEESALAEVDRLAREPVHEAELAKVKKQAKAQFIFTRDGVYRIAMGLGAFAVVDGPEAFDTLLRRIEQVTAADVMQVTVAYLHERSRTVGWYLFDAGSPAGPHPTPEHAVHGGAHHDGTFWFTPPRSDADGVQFVQAHSPTLPITPEVVTRAEPHNGLVTLVRENRGAGLVTVYGYVKAGAMFDGDRSGLSRFVAAMLQRGTRSRSSQEIAEALDKMGASLVIRAEMETVAISLRALAEDAFPALQIMGEVLMYPTFLPEEVEKARGEILTSLRIAMQDTRQVAERTFRKLLFPPSHPHFRHPDGEESVIDSIRPKDLHAFHEAYYRPEGTILAVVGDLPAARALDAVSRVFSPWLRGGTWRLPAVPPVQLSPTPVRRDVRLPGKIQSDIAIGAPGIARSDPAYYEMMMANLILGQLGLMGRLGDRVRERQGMAYYAFSDLRAGLLAGPWSMRAGVNPQNEESAIASILAEIRRFQNEGPQEQELADARDFLTGSLAVRLETNSGIAQTLADIELYGLGLDHLVRYPQIIRSIPSEAVTQAARRFPSDSYCAAVAGPSLSAAEPASARGERLRD